MPVATSIPVEETRRLEQSDPRKPVMRRLLGLTWRYRLGCIAVISLALAMEVFALAGLKFVGIGIDFLHHRISPETVAAPLWPLGLGVPEDWSIMHGLGMIAGLVVLAALVAGTLRFATTMSQAILVQKVLIDMRSEVYAKLQRLSFRFYDANESGSIINRVTTDVGGTRQFLDQVMLQSLLIMAKLTIYTIAMLQLNVNLTLACLAATPFMALRAAHFGAVVRPAYKEARKRVDDLVKVLSQNVQGIHVVKGFAREQAEIAAFEQANDRVREQSHWIFKRVSLFSPTIHLLSESSLVILLAYGGYLYLQGSLGLGDGLVVFAALLQQYNSQVSSIAGITNSIQNSLTSAGRVFEVLDTPVEVDDKADAIPLPHIKGHVRFEHAGFAYRGHDRVLEDITLDVKPGEIVALLGATGAGKSTLLSLIPRFYDPTLGRIRIDGHDLPDVKLTDLRRHIGVVFQDNFLFSTTVTNNISFGHHEATQEEVELAAKIAQADTFINQLPEGYDTVIGEKGTDLSGGQRQRLAIARAVLTDPKILLLDDATAAIDPETEDEIMSAMDSAMQGRTTFIIAHRLSTLRRADRVVVLERGRIVEVGRHDELMTKNGHYKEVAEAQCAGGESRRLLGIKEGR